MPEQNNEPIYKVPPIDPYSSKTSWLRSHMILGVVFLIAVLAAIVAGIYYWQTTSNIPATVNTPVHQDPTKDWKTYTNTEYGFEFKYPKNLFQQDHKSNLKVLSELETGVTDSSITVLIESSKNLTISEYTGDLQLYQINIGNNINAFKADIGAGGVIIFIPHEGNYISFTSLMSSGQKTIDGILSTFKFTTPTVQINSFAACAAAGNPIMESFPEQCRTPDGLTFVKPQGACIQVIAKAKHPASGEVREFPTPCDIPVGWTGVKS